MAARSGAKTLPLGSVLGYAEIADRMGVKVRSVREYAWRDPDFPKPVTPESFRSPGFSEVDVERYIELRRVRGQGSGGRPVRGRGEERLELNPVIGSRIRDLLSKSEAGPKTVAELAPLIGMSTATLGMRMRNGTRWKREELEALGEVFGQPVSFFTDPEPAPVKRRRPASGSRSRKSDS